MFLAAREAQRALAAPDAMTRMWEEYNDIAWHQNVAFE